MKEIILNRVRKTLPNYRKFVALVDDEDFERVNQFFWYADKDENTFYAVARIQNKLIYMHTFLTGFKQTDHKDMNGLNNQRNNLRKATTQENLMNRKSFKNSSSQFKGVSWDGTRNKWIARIRLNNKSIHLGRFISETDAAKAYNQKAKELFGEFAKLNII